MRPFLDGFQRLAVYFFSPFKEPSRELIQRFNREFNLRIRFAVIGHTHDARIAIHAGGEDFFALIDSWAWVESCEVPNQPRLPNAPLTAHGQLKRIG